MSGTRLTRYQQLAEDMADAIRAGLLRPGERLPSVRVTCEQRRVSPSTVFQAYGHLESLGLIEARPVQATSCAPRAARCGLAPSRRPRAAKPRRWPSGLEIKEAINPAEQVIAERDQ